MKRYEISSTIPAPHFIGAWELEPTDICDDLITFFENHTAKQKQGEFSSGIDPLLKKSIDITIKPKDLKLKGYQAFSSYMEKLLLCYQDYREQWPFLSKYLNQVHIGAFNLQRYHKGDHYNAVHSERMGLASSHKLFAWMTYLNDVDDGGETEFPHFGISVKPKKGTTLIWPSEWTHAHSGNTLNSGSKYIITGGMHFPE
ncbi:MAG: 2OG-Fe(II) oxygenase [Euryarchaeota archaeon]|nr:2OG-Fe(II) oxygenase [Euryarchaeota archaeon]|tara:strand:- start:1352 stop:1951 length:600 start_codon:yes stop_codon:yes gene_type:complete